MESEPIESRLISVGNGTYINVPKAVCQLLGKKAGSNIRYKIIIEKNADGEEYTLKSIGFHNEGYGSPSLGEVEFGMSSLPLAKV